jgi:hypothetical protein
MTDQKSDGNALYGVGCDVMTCKYHEGGNQCCANSISIEAPTAAKKTETFCGTFTPRPSASL